MKITIAMNFMMSLQTKNRGKTRIPNATKMLKGLAN